MYQQDWEDYHAMTVPFVFERLVIADRSAAVKAGEPAYASALSLEASAHWWEPVRKNMAQYLGEYEVKKRSKVDITYIHNQGSSGAKLTDEDHDTLVKGLQNLAWKEGYEVNIISTELTQTNWTTRMTGIVKSSVSGVDPCNLTLLIALPSRLYWVSTGTTYWMGFSCARVRNLRC